MKNKLLILSFAFLAEANVEACQDFMVTNYHSNSRGHFYDSDFSSQPSRRSIELKTTTDPYELAEKSDESFNKQNFQDAAKFLIDSAIYGNEDNISFLYDIDPSSIKDLSSKKNELISKVVSHMEQQYEILQKYKNKPITLYWVDSK